MTPSWLKNVPEDAVKYWLHHTPTPMLRSKLDGKILGCNSAFESLTGYTSHEFERGDIGWDELTVSKNDLAADQALAREVAMGERHSYRITKSYANKNGPPTDGSICVFLSPETPPVKSEEDIGDVIFLVTVTPIGEHGALLTSEVAQMRLEMLEVKQLIVSQPNAWGFLSMLLAELKSLIGDHKFASAIVALFIGAMCFGEAFREAVEWAFGLMGFQKSGPS